MRGIDSIANAVTPRRREPLDSFLVGERLEEADQHLAVAQRAELLVVGLRTLATSSAAQRVAELGAGFANASSVKGGLAGAALDDAPRCPS